MKTIYQPKGKAGEYAKYAVNFYNGCSNGCEYCYLKRGVLSKTLGGNAPTLQKKYNGHRWKAIICFIEDIDENIDELRKHGLFFTFTSDPLLIETRELNVAAVKHAIGQYIPCTLLTKRAEADYLIENIPSEQRHLVAVGFTLTGKDRLEPNASTTFERANAMSKLLEAGFKTWASIEPIIDISNSAMMMSITSQFCDLYKVGLRSGVKKDYYSDLDLRVMFDVMRDSARRWNTPIYLKESFVERLKIDRSSLEFPFVNSEFSLFR